MVGLPESQKEFEQMVDQMMRRSRPSKRMYLTWGEIQHMVRRHFRVMMEKGTLEPGPEMSEAKRRAVRHTIIEPRQN